MDLKDFLDLVKYGFVVCSLVGGMYGAFKIFKAAVDTFAALTGFLKHDVGKISESLGRLEHHAEKAMSNHLPHMEAAAIGMADSLAGVLATMRKQAEDFRNHELQDAAVQGSLLEQLKDLKQEVRSQNR